MFSIFARRQEAVSEVLEAMVTAMIQRAVMRVVSSASIGI